MLLLFLMNTVIKVCDLVGEMKQYMLGLNVVIYYFRETLLCHSQVSGLLLFADS